MAIFFLHAAWTFLGKFSSLDDSDYETGRQWEKAAKDLQKALRAIAKVKKTRCDMLLGCVSHSLVSVMYLYI